MLLLSGVLLAGCASHAAGANQVKVTKSAADVASCVLLGRVAGQAPYDGPKDAIDQMRDQVIGLGSYKPVAGVMFPFSISHGPKNHPDAQIFTAQKIEVNVAIDPADFALPASLKIEEKKSGIVGIH